MVRLYYKQFKKVKPNQLLWFVMELADGKIVKHPFKCLGIKKINKNHTYSNTKYLCAVKNYGGNLWSKTPANQQFDMKVLGSTQRKTRWFTKHLSISVKCMYFAKVTRKEEPEFLAMLLSL